MGKHDSTDADGATERRVALVTGAGSGIGLGAALRLAREGLHVVVVGHSQSSADDAAEEVRAVADGGQVLPLGVDVEDAAQVRDAVARVERELGRIDVVVASAGINGVWAPLEELEPEEWSRTIAVNLTGTFHTVKYAVPLLKARGGAVVIVSSINGTRTFSNTGASAYSSSKAGQVAFAKMIAVELAEHGVRVNVICPGAIDTEIGDNTEHRNTEDLGVAADFPDGTIPLTGTTSGTSDQVGDLVWFLTSDASSHVTGTEVWIDGGQSLVV
ncbi:3-oxoacyl-[acyl-carrier-protein] reductase [Serinibacter arcticus]|uniref:3-oxoacyl-[acyl-carrier-protein] reductase n=1 Tax=Serinibacter arcticus TaxID=1655435 RepID=A0A2U1ZUX4_9MICO|nr:SDR family NAD(P)-dependent oxidoreductase [Serinibacter arcticus]PWD50753.1 3-oxoacyl-[acyl-carrier-protein] reductase [Serinibacter arcticus]